MKERGDNVTGRELLYEELSGRIVAMIRSGTYRPGERIPSLRALSRQMRVSVNTVMGAYAQLENIGMIEARPQPGFHVRSACPEPEADPVSRREIKDITPNPVTCAILPFRSWPTW